MKGDLPPGVVACRAQRWKFEGRVAFALSFNLPTRCEAVSSTSDFVLWRRCRRTSKLGVDCGRRVSTRDEQSWTDPRGLPVCRRHPHHLQHFRVRL